MTNTHDESSLSRYRANLRGRILYVDDDAEYAALLSRLLDRLGYAVVTCWDSASALDLLKAIGDHCDLFISDCHLMGEDGVDLACEVAKRYPGIAVGVISNDYNDVALRAIARCVPAAPKPESRGECVALLARLNFHKAN